MARGAMIGTPTPIPRKQSRMGTSGWQRGGRVDGAHNTFEPELGRSVLSRCNGVHPSSAGVFSLTGIGFARGRTEGRNMGFD